jgi:hypothetical protein
MNSLLFLAEILTIYLLYYYQICVLKNSIVHPVHGHINQMQYKTRICEDILKKAGFQERYTSKF